MILDFVAGPHQHWFWTIRRVWRVTTSVSVKAGRHVLCVLWVLAVPWQFIMTREIRIIINITMYCTKRDTDKRWFDVLASTTEYGSDDSVISLEFAKGSKERARIDLPRWFGRRDNIDWSRFKEWFHSNLISFEVESDSTYWSTVLEMRFWTQVYCQVTGTTWRTNAVWTSPPWEFDPWHRDRYTPPCGRRPCISSEQPSQ